MVLRLDDATLATLIRALREVPVAKRKHHLQKLAAKADPSRQLRRYYRRKAGHMSLHLEIDPEGVADCLRSVGISVWEIDKPTLKAAIESFFVAWELGVFHLVHDDGE
jgi:hypothetical protein